MKHGRCRCWSVVVCAALTLLPLPAFAQASTEYQHETPAIAKPQSPLPAGERPAMQAVKTTGPMKIDGVLDETSWSSAPVVDRFIQQEPQEGQPASDRTEVRVMYDAGHTDGIARGHFREEGSPVCSKGDLSVAAMKFKVKVSSFKLSPKF